MLVLHLNNTWNEAIVEHYISNCHSGIVIRQLNIHLNIACTNAQS